MIHLVSYFLFIIYFRSYYRMNRFLEKQNMFLKQIKYNLKMCKNIIITKTTMIINVFTRYLNDTNIHLLF